MIKMAPYVKNPAVLPQGSSFLIHFLLLAPDFKTLVIEAYNQHYCGIKNT
jgi:hypothetical protein